MAASVADVAAVEAGLTAALLQQHHGRHISRAPMVLLDGNLSQQRCWYAPACPSAITTGMQNQGIYEYAPFCAAGR